MKPRCTLPLAALALIATAAPAAAGTAAVPNSCRWSVDDVYRDLDVNLTGTAAPSPLAPGGAATLTWTAAQSRIPDYVASNGYNTGLLKAGPNTIPATIWLAIAAGGQTRVVSATVTASTTITVDGEQNFVSATPMDVTVPMADSTWTAPGEGALAFTQAPAGSLPPLPIGNSDNLRQPVGSAVIQASLSNDVKIVLDCQPGRSQRGTTTSSAVPQTPSAFESVPVVADAPVVQPPPPVVAPLPPQPTLVSPLLRARRGRIAMVVGCGRRAGACFGTVEVRTALPQRIGGRRVHITIARGTYATGTGGRSTLDLAVLPAARALVKRKPSLPVRVRMFSRETPRTAALTRQVTLRS